jgi:hypothetical protein
LLPLSAVDYNNYKWMSRQSITKHLHSIDRTSETIPSRKVSPIWTIPTYLYHTHNFHFFPKSEYSLPIRAYRRCRYTIDIQDMPVI